MRLKAFGRFATTNITPVSLDVNNTAMTIHEKKMSHATKNTSAFSQLSFDHAI